MEVHLFPTVPIHFISLAVFGFLWLTWFGDFSFALSSKMSLIPLCVWVVGLDLYIVEGANPGFSYQVEAYDPEDTSHNIPLSVSLLVTLERG